MSTSFYVYETQYEPKGDEGMNFKLGDYVKHKEHPNSAPILLVQQWHVDMVNAKTEKYERSSEKEYDRWWGKQNEQC